MIFVALAVAWAVYLIPKALRHHDEVARSRSVDRFSNTMRVLARREPSGANTSRLVVQPGRGRVPASVTVKGADPSTREQLAVRRESARVATGRRRRVLGIVASANVLVAALAIVGIFGWVWQAIPAGLLVAWLVACRLMVKQEIAADTVLLSTSATGAEETDDAEIGDAEIGEEFPESYDVARNEQGFDEVADSADTATFPAVDPDLWDPVPVTLPTYVNKATATRRSVRTINLGDEKVWTSGRTEEFAALAREADAAVVAEREGRLEAGEERCIVNG